MNKQIGDRLAAEDIALIPFYGTYVFGSLRTAACLLARRIQFDVMHSFHQSSFPEFPNLHASCLPRSKVLQR